MKREWLTWLIRCGVLSCSFGLTSLAAEPQSSFEVRHDHLVGSCRGVLVVGERGVEFQADNKKDARSWKYEDIQELALLSPKRLTLVGYDSRNLHFGRDERFNFLLTQDELTDALRISVQARLSRPLVSAIVPPPAAVRFQIPVRHQHALGGCQGVLEVNDDLIVYRADRPAESRVWRYEDIASFGSTGPYQLRVGVLERSGAGHGERNFVFDLKRQADPAAYDFIWWKLHPTLSVRSRP